jgi:hypothetical protein
MDYAKRYYSGYELQYWFQPGLWAEEELLEALMLDARAVNRLSGKDLSYGIFDPSHTNLSLKELLSSMNLCIIYEKGEPMGLFYNLVLALTPRVVIHAGLVMIGRNTGVDLIGYPYSYMTILQYQKYGTYVYTNISSTPSIVGVFSDSFSNVWPNYKGNQLKPPHAWYRSVLDILEAGYIRKYFKGEVIEIDRKRFVMSSHSQKMGFQTSLKKLSRYRKPQVNYFCMYWLDYSAGEDLIQVGLCDLKAVWKIKAYYSIQGLLAGWKRKKGEVLHA